MTHEMEVLDATGHVTLRWDPADPESVAKARAEFDRMRGAGFAFFTTTAVDALDPAAGTIDGRLEQTQEFRPRSRRTLAVAPLKGG